MVILQSNRNKNDRIFKKEELKVGGTELDEQSIKIPSSINSNSKKHISVERTNLGEKNKKIFSNNIREVT